MSYSEGYPSYAKGPIHVLRAAARRYNVRYRVLIARAKGTPPNTSRGGQNTHLNDAQDAALRLYCERCIKAGLNPLCAVGEPQFLKARKAAVEWAEIEAHF